MFRLPRFKRHLTTVILAAWFGLLVVAGAGLLARHLVALPLPEGERLAAALALQRSASEKHQWLAIHVLYSDCRCSQRIADHLAESERPNGFAEIVLWIGAESPSAKLVERFDVRHVTAAELAGWGIEAAPSLFVLDPDDHVRYSGGYTDRKQGPVVDDLRILEATRVSRSVPSLPVFGCAVSDRLKNQLSTLPTP